MREREGSRGTQSFSCPTRAFRAHSSRASVIPLSFPFKRLPRQSTHAHKLKSSIPRALDAALVSNVYIISPLSIIAFFLEILYIYVRYCLHSLNFQITLKTRGNWTEHSQSLLGWLLGTRLVSYWPICFSVSRNSPRRLFES